MSQALPSGRPPKGLRKGFCLGNLDDLRPDLRAHPRPRLKLDRALDGDDKDGGNNGEEDAAILVEPQSWISPYCLGISDNFWHLQSDLKTKNPENSAWSRSMRCWSTTRPKQKHSRESKNGNGDGDHWRRDDRAMAKTTIGQTDGPHERGE